MPETLEKLRPDRDLQCYFERPSAICALSEASPNAFKLTGTWRQQFDWAVIEWNRDNVFEHPAFRNLPDGDLSGLTLTYDETRLNCIPLESDLYPTVDWPYLRVWASNESGEQLYKVRLLDYATPLAGSFQPASIELEILGSVTPGDTIGLAWLSEQHNYEFQPGDTLASALEGLKNVVNQFSLTADASRSGTKIRLTLKSIVTGVNGNRAGVYGYVAGAKTEYWSPWFGRFGGGVSPSDWRITLPFGSLLDVEGRTLPTNRIRKMRWTYSADLQPGAFVRSEFNVQVTNWNVSGAGRPYRVTGPGSRRIEDDDHGIAYSGSWSSSTGNFSGGSIRYTTAPLSSLSLTYSHPQHHELYLGTRLAANGAVVSISVDGEAPQPLNLELAGEDVLIRAPLGERGPGTHTIRIGHTGEDGAYFYFDYIELAMPSMTLPEFPVDRLVNPATDWDTDHSLPLPAERTAWMIHTTGLHGRANHYVGALWFYELVRTGHQYASGTVDFAGTPVFGGSTTLNVQDATITHTNLLGDTAETIAKAFELEINRGYTAVWAEAAGSRLTIHARQMGMTGNQITLTASPVTGEFTALASGQTLTGGADGNWHTDLTSVPRLNRAVRDWSRAFFSALHGFGIDAVAAFSTELQHGDSSVDAGIAQRYPSGNPVLLNTPALQTNFSPTSITYFREVYREMAQVMHEAGCRPFLQFGEVQWWYFPYDGSGLPFHDDYTKSAFQAAYGRPLSVIATPDADPAAHPEEAAFLPGLIGNYTAQIMDYVRQSYGDCRFEVLYPLDVNEGAFNKVINYPVDEWTPAKLDSLKTESFGYTFARNLNLSSSTIEHGATRGFPPSKRSYLVGVGVVTTPWLKEVSLAKAAGLESVTLFALDQFCLCAYPLPLPSGARRALLQG